MPSIQKVRLDRTPQPISQERLKLGVELMRQEWAAVQARQNYLRELMADLASGGDVETGELELNLANGVILPRQEPRLAPVLAMKTGARE